MSDHPLIFGIYPGGPSSLDPAHAPGPDNDPAHIQAALDALHAPGQPFIVRAYQMYLGRGELRHITPPDFDQYAVNGRKLDLVLIYRMTQEDFADWTGYIREMVARYGPVLACLQIAEEPNSTGIDGDGNSANVHGAIVAGVLAAKDEARRLGYDVQIGMNSTISFSPADTFWPVMGEHVTPEFLASLDYVALDFFPDVFRRLAPDGQPGDLTSMVPVILEHFRNNNLAAGRIPPSVPMHIGENGWPTGPDRPFERQAQVIEQVIRTVYARRVDLNITHYEFFDLRDADSSNPTLGFEFGLLRDDYTPKPAFEVYRRLVRELG